VSENGLLSTREEHALRYFVTGATGFIGRHLVQELLRNREGEIFVLVRESSKERLQKLVEGWPGGERVTPVVGDLTNERLGVEQAWIDEQRGTIDHFFHLAAVYDMTADSEANDLANVTGTRNAVALANALEAGILHHASSVAVSGLPLADGLALEAQAGPAIFAAAVAGAARFAGGEGRGGAGTGV